MIDWPYPRIIAHRGAGKLAPENTLAAMQVALQHRQKMVEFDVKLSADDVAVLMHDANLDRTTNGIGPIRQFNWAELARLDAGSWHSEAFAGEPIPRLDSALAWLLEKGMLANVEIKPSPGLELHSGRLIARACKTLWTRQDIPCLLSSFSEAALQAAMATAPALPRALLMDRLFPDWLARCRRLDCVAVDWNEGLINAALVRDAHAAGLRVLVYTVNDPQRAKQLLDWGVDSVITDWVDQLSPQG
ncbi:MAG: glycerophosphodiester phosphodiesterase [Betaproteobacteria bacterium]|nr:glycerophosphodiester phosphodiesterase [Betaproteobacteria bacterium]